MDKQYFIYIMTNKVNTVFYTGVTSDLAKRTFEHKNRLVKSFTQKYNIMKLVYYEIFDNPESAIAREKQIKAGLRKKKLGLITNQNPNFQDLYPEII